MDREELGVTEEMVEGIAGRTMIKEGGYKILNRNKIKGILEKSMR